MKKCNKCLLPETYETIEFSNNGSCNICDGVINKKKILIGKIDIMSLKKL